jgi:hypothetical protein
MSTGVRHVRPDRRGACAPAHPAPMARPDETVQTVREGWQRSFMRDRDAHAHAEEARQIQAAAARLLAGAPQRSNGRLCVVTLAGEAWLNRARLYEQHGDLVDAFLADARR